MPSSIHPVAGTQVYLAQSINTIQFTDEFRIFKPNRAFHCRSQRDNFGPLNLSSIVHFIRALEQEVADYPDAKIVLCIEEGRRELTNAVYLLGAYLILKFHMCPTEVMARFAWLDSDQLAPYRDASFLEPDFCLSISDCFRALARGKALAWVRYAARGYMWGAVDIDEYRHYDQPANGDVHELVPGELVALPSPVDLDGADFRDGPDGVRAFSPAYAAETLRDLGVTTLVRLNAAPYNAAPLTARGIRVVDLPCPDAGRPPDAAVAAFVREMDAADGPVAVHCATGRAQTGTLAALHLMRSHGFTARAAMGWLRIVRPGSVIGEQQRFLSDVGAALGRLRGRPRGGRNLQAAGGGDSDSQWPAAPPRALGLKPVPEGEEAAPEGEEAT